MRVEEPTYLEVEWSLVGQLLWPARGIAPAKTNIELFPLKTVNRRISGTTATRRGP